MPPLGLSIVFAINGFLVLYVFNFDRKIKRDRNSELLCDRP